MDCCCYFKNLSIRLHQQTQNTMKSKIFPVFNSQSAMHRVFGDLIERTEIRCEESILSPVLIQRDGPDGVVEIRTRTWHWKPTYAPKGTVTTRFECYYNGILVDYTCDRKLIVKTLRWLAQKGQIHKSYQSRPTQMKISKSERVPGSVVSPKNNHRPQPGFLNLKI